MCTRVVWEVFFAGVLVTHGCAVQDCISVHSHSKPVICLDWYAGRKGAGRWSKPSDGPSDSSPPSSLEPQKHCFSLSRKSFQSPNCQPHSLSQCWSSLAAVVSSVKTPAPGGTRAESWASAPSSLCGLLLAARGVLFASPGTSVSRSVWCGSWAYLLSLLQNVFQKCHEVSEQKCPRMFLGEVISSIRCSEISCKGRCEYVHLDFQ